tara:strand:+ start:366 stop:701 length:336 start_codon:yes stop_codon:yes gene_type:complete
MAIFSSHLLNSINGTHAIGVKVSIFQINSKGEKKLFLETKTDEGGRILKNFDLTNEDCLCDYEMICNSGDYFAERRIVSEIVVKFKMKDPNKKYHLPIMMSPNSYSIWWSE